MLTIVIHNEKGGVGKTETARWFAELLARRGRVLLLDSDPQADLTLRMSQVPGSAMLSMYKDEAVTLTPVSANLDLVVSMPGLEIVNDMLSKRRFGQLGVLSKRLQQYAPEYAYCVIDTPTPFEYLTLNAYCAADWLIVPMRPNDDDLAGVSRTISTLDQLAADGVKTPQPVGLIATAYRGRVNEHVDTISMLRHPHVAWRWHTESARWPALLGVVPQAEGSIRHTRRERSAAYQQIVESLFEKKGDVQQ